MNGSALRCAYADIKTVRTRKVYQLVFEGPIEEMGLAMQLFGPPTPDTAVWAGIARLRDTTAPAARGGALAQRAALLCNDARFNAWAQEHGFEDGKAYIYDRCSVSSRADLDRNQTAGLRFIDMTAEYESQPRAAVPA